MQLRRRYDLIPNLVETVKGYASHERAHVRGGDEGAHGSRSRRGTVPEQAQAENVLTAAIGLRGRRGLSRAARDRELPAAPGAAYDTEQKIAVSRQVYNDAVLSYDNGGSRPSRRTSWAACSTSKRNRISRSRNRPSREAPRGPVLRAYRLPRGRPHSFCSHPRRRRLRSLLASPTHVEIPVEPDGSLLVEEPITFLFEGSFSGAFREIPRSKRARGRGNIFVAEGSERYSPWRCRLSSVSAGLPGRYGVAGTSKGGTRIVWHFRAL